MASHESDLNLLCDLAFSTQGSNAALSGTLYRILGLSVRLSPRLILARRRRKLESARDARSLDLYHRIIWMSREGLSLTEHDIIPNVQQGGFGHAALDRDLRIFSAKLRASFYHIICLFHNQPPVSNSSPSGQHKNSSPSSGNGHRKRHSGGGSTSRNRIDKGKGREAQGTTRSRDRTSALRETIPSMISEASYITNPFSSPAISPPPGLPHPSAFLLPPADYRPVAEGAFKTALGLAADLPGSAPLRLSIALEYAAFLWDCKNDHGAARRLAQSTIRTVYRASEGMDDDEFQEAAALVGALGRMMKRASNEATPRIGAASPGAGNIADATAASGTESPASSTSMQPLHGSSRSQPPRFSSDIVRPTTAHGLFTPEQTPVREEISVPSAPSPSPVKTPVKVIPRRPVGASRSPAAGPKATQR